MSKAPADYLDDAWIELEAGPLAMMGLVLGYPPLVTAGWLQRPASMWVERGSLPSSQSRRRDRAADNAAAVGVGVRADARSRRVLHQPSADPLEQGQPGPTPRR